jgi:hypothetical protein
MFSTINLSSNFFNGSIPDSWAPLLITSRGVNLNRLQLSGPLPGALWGGVNYTAFAR